MLLFVGALVVGNDTASGAAATGLLGDWQLNRELTEKRRPKLPKARASNSGFGTGATIGAGGVLMPVPGPGNRAPAGPTKNLPKVLGCVQLSLTQHGQDITATCPELDAPRIFKIGKLHGRTVKFSSRKMTEKYSSTSRRVTHTFLLERSGLLEVKVTVKPKGAKMRTYILVFDRATDAGVSS